MATSVQDIYKRFLAQIGKDVIVELEQELAEELMQIYLEGAISMFDICEKDLTIEKRVRTIERLPARLYNKY